nr:hypothetical protein [Tanacetum cinerariifolium]
MKLKRAASRMKQDGIFISQDKYVAKSLRKFGLNDEKLASTPIDTEKPLLKDPDREDVDVHTYRLIVTAVSSKFLLFESIACLPNEEIFIELSRMGYKKPSTKLTFYNAFFSAQWNFLIHTILQAQVGDLSSHTTKYSFPALTQKVFANMGRVGKGFSGVETPLFEGMLVPPQAVVDDDDVVADNVLIDDVAANVHAADAEPNPTSPPSTILLWMIRRMHLNRGVIADLDADKDVTLEEVEVEKIAKVEKDADVQGRLKESQAKVYHIDLEHADKVLITAATTTITAAAPIIAAIITAAPSAARRRKGIVIRDLEETATPSTIIHSESKSKDKGKGIMVEEPKPLKKQAQIEQDEAYARDIKEEATDRSSSQKEYDGLPKNTVGFKMDYFKGMRYDNIRPIFEKYFNSNVAFLEKSKEELEEEESRALKRKTESSEEKAVKKQKFDEEVKELKKHLQIVPNDDDDVYTEATPLALKMILLVDRRYPLIRFTLDQMLNNVRLEVEEETLELMLLKTLRIYSKGLLLLVKDLLLLEQIDAVR